MAHVRYLRRNPALDWINCSVGLGPELRQLQARFPLVYPTCAIRDSSWSTLFNPEEEFKRKFKFLIVTNFLEVY
jgi:hypothetical protein